MNRLTYFDDEQKCWTTFSCDDCEDLKRLKAERDAAIADMYGHCSRCKYFRGSAGAEKCATCVNTVGTEQNWEWRGPQQEET